MTLQYRWKLCRQKLRDGYRHGEISLSPLKSLDCLQTNDTTYKALNIKSRALSTRYTAQSILYISRVLLLSTILLTNSTTLAFFNQSNQYRGFYWFEQKPIDQTKTKFHYPTAEEARASLSIRKQALDNARNQMSELSFRENTPPEELRKAVLKYKQLEAKMFDGSLRLFDATEMVNFTNPELTSQIPTNVFANKIKRQANQQKNERVIKEFGKDFDLLLFTRDTCPYSQAFVPVATNFSQQNQIQLDVTTLDSEHGRIAQSIGVNSVPTLVAIKKDGSALFEVARGMISYSELEQSMLLAKAYNDELVKRKSNHNRGNHRNGVNYRSRDKYQRNKISTQELHHNTKAKQ